MKPIVIPLAFSFDVFGDLVVQEVEPGVIRMQLPERANNVLVLPLEALKQIVAAFEEEAG